MQSGLAGATPDTVQRYRLFFLLAALFDIGLGVAFLLALRPLFAWLGVPVPENVTYASLAAGLVAVQGVGYLLVWRHLWRNIDLVKLGIVYKLMYVGVAVAALIRGDLPHPLFTWFAVVDVAFLVGFLLFLRTASEVRHQERASIRAGHALNPPQHWTREG